MPGGGRRPEVEVQPQDPLLNFAKSLTHALIQRLRSRRGTSAAPQRLLAWYMPLFILSLIATWFVLALCAFGALYWAVGAETTLRGTLIASGSALTTLGFATPSTLPGQVLGIMEGAIGLIIMVFMLSFIPAYQAAVQARTLTDDYLEFLPAGVTYSALGGAAGATASITTNVG